MNAAETLIVALARVDALERAAARREQHIEALVAALRRNVDEQDGCWCYDGAPDGPPPTTPCSWCQGKAALRFRDEELDEWLS